MATEVAYLPLLDGHNPDDPKSEAGRAWKSILDQLRQVDGFQRIFWSREIQHPNIIHGFIDWDSVDHHKRFSQTPAYGPFVDHFKKFTQFEKAVLYHAHLSPFPASQVLSKKTSPVTEVVTVFFPADYSQTDQGVFDDNMVKMSKVAKDNTTSFTGYAGGWADEEQPIPDTDGVAGKVYKAFLGWESVEANTQYQETQAFKDSIHLLKDSKDLKGVHVMHVSCSELAR